MIRCGRTCTGAAHLVTDPVLLTAAASIMTVEARHQTMLNVLTASGTAIPQAFDIPLTPPEVLAIAGGFISGCDTGVTGQDPVSFEIVILSSFGLIFDVSSSS